MTKRARSYRAAIVPALAAGALVAGLGAQGPASAPPPAPVSPAAAQAAVPCPRPANAPPLVPATPLARAHPRGAVVTTDLPTPGAANKYSNPRAAR